MLSGCPFLFFNLVTYLYLGFISLSHWIHTQSLTPHISWINIASDSQARHNKMTTVISIFFLLTRLSPQLKYTNKWNASTIDKSHTHNSSSLTIRFHLFVKRLICRDFRWGLHWHFLRISLKWLRIEKSTYTFSLNRPTKTICKDNKRKRAPNLYISVNLSWLLSVEVKRIINMNKFYPVHRVKDIRWIW